MSDLISRQDAIDAMDKLWGDIKRTNKRVAKGHEAVYLDMRGTIKSLPSADRPTTDCTKFMEWLKAEVLDEENWELNAVANGEIICRKFKKLGWLDVEDGYYVDTRPTVDKEYLIDLIQESVYDGEACAKLIDMVDRPAGEWIYNNKNGTFKIWDCSECGISMEAQWNYCPNCGAKMGGEEHD